MGSILFGNIRIKNIYSDAIEGCLNIHALYSGREYIDIRYDGVYYNQFEEKHIGSTILFAQSLSLNELCRLSERDLLKKILTEFAYADTNFLVELEQKGYNFYVNYINENAECIVIAKNCKF